MKFLSVIIPLYKYTDKIKRCLDSLLNQNFDDVEIIVVDSINCELPKNDKIKIVKSQRQGLLSLIDGVENSNGKYLWFVNPFDYVEEDSLNIIYESLYVSNADILKFNYRLEFNGERKSMIDIYPSGVYENPFIKRVKKSLVIDTAKKPSFLFCNIYKKDLVNIDLLKESLDLFLYFVFINNVLYLSAKSIQVIGDINYCKSIDGENKIELRRPLESAIDGYYIVKKYLSKELFEEYKNELLFALVDVHIFGGGIKNYGSIVQEYSNAKSQEEARKFVQSVLASESFKTILKEAEGRELPDFMKKLFEFAKNQDEQGIYDFLGKLATSQERIS